MQDLSHKVKENIAKCAIELFKSEGYDSVSVNEICEKANVSRPVFYTMFKGKRGILDYIVSKPQQNDDEGFRALRTPRTILNASGSCLSGLYPLLSILGRS